VEGVLIPARRSKEVLYVKIWKYLILAIVKFLVAAKNIISTLIIQFIHLMPVRGGHKYDIESRPMPEILEKMDVCGAYAPHTSIFSKHFAPGWKRGAKM
jgi:hypothetical protein